MKIYTSPDREIHLFDEVVGVCWNINRNGKDKECYIDFVTIIEESDSEWFEDEDSPASGGISVYRAEILLQALTKAIEYAKKLEG